MIATKFCDVCDTELPPMCFQPSYECCDVQPHAKHPDRAYSNIRITAHPVFTNGSPARQVDLCPDCFLALCKSLVKRMEARNKREAGKINGWKTWRAVSRKEDVVRDGANEQHTLPDKSSMISAKK